MSGDQFDRIDLTVDSSLLECKIQLRRTTQHRYYLLKHKVVGGPRWRRDRAEALLRRLEGRIGRIDGELTPREREVASLIAEGLTNGQMAERLYISPKTAAVHVSNILMKLGLAGRAEVAAWAVRQGIDATST